MTPATLRARIAASDEAEKTVFVRNEDRILSAAFDALIPKPAKICDTDPYSQTSEYQDWCRLQARFIELSRSPIEAALFIAEAVLPGCKVVSWPDYAEIFSPDHKQIPAPVEEPLAGSADTTTRALAILDAVCAAVEKGEG